jgi:hypothetical protein
MTSGDLYQAHTSWVPVKPTTFDVPISRASSSTSASRSLCVTCRGTVCRPTARATALRMVLRIYAPVSGNHTARYFVKRKHKNLLR